MFYAIIMVYSLKSAVDMHKSMHYNIYIFYAILIYERTYCPSFENRRTKRIIVGYLFDKSNSGSTAPRVVFTESGFDNVAIDGSRIVTIKGTV
jgi:hypothetical protein